VSAGGYTDKHGRENRQREVTAGMQWWNKHKNSSGVEECPDGIEMCDLVNGNKMVDSFDIRIATRQMWEVVHESSMYDLGRMGFSSHTYIAFSCKDPMGTNDPVFLKNHSFYPSNLTKV
jgi:hypothetical protein